MLSSRDSHNQNLELVLASIAPAYNVYFFNTADRARMPLVAGLSLYLTSEISSISVIDNGYVGYYGESYYQESSIDGKIKSVHIIIAHHGYVKHLDRESVNKALAILKNHAERFTQAIVVAAEKQYFCNVTITYSHTGHAFGALLARTCTKHLYKNKHKDHVLLPICFKIPGDDDIKSAGHGSLADFYWDVNISGLDSSSVSKCSESEEDYNTAFKNIDFVSDSTQIAPTPINPLIFDPGTELAMVDFTDTIDRRGLSSSLITKISYSQAFANKSAFKNNAFDSQPDDTTLKIISLLPPEAIAKTSTVDKRFYTLCSNQSLWQDKFTKHFGKASLRKELKYYSIMKIYPDWRDKFKIAYQNQYENIISRRIRRLFSIAKEGDLRSFQIIMDEIKHKESNILTILSYLVQTNSGNESSSILWYARLFKHQILLDYIYNELVIPEYDKFHYYRPLHLQRDNLERTILHWAIICHQPQSVIEYLFSKDRELIYAKSEGASPIHFSAQEGDHQTILRLLNNGVDCNLSRGGSGWTALHIACMYGHLNVVSVLLAKKANIDMVDFDLNTPIHHALIENHEHLVDFLRKAGADLHTVNAHGCTLLHSAASVGNLSMVNLLLSMDDTNPFAQDVEGNTPLHLAAKSGHLAIIKALVARSNLDLINNHGLTPLFVACVYDCVEVIKFLISYEHNKNKLCFKGYTLLMHAASAGSVNAVNFLIRFGCDVNFKATDDKTALMEAVTNGHPHIVQLLSDGGADINLAFFYMTSNPEVLTVIFKHVLLNYIKERGAVDAPKYLTSFEFLGFVFNFGKSKEEAVAAAKALVRALNNKEEKKSMLLPHLQFLQDGRLKQIYKSCQSVLNPKPKM